MKRAISYLKNNKHIIIFTFIESFLQIYGYLLTNNKSIIDYKGKYILYFIVVYLLLYLINNIIFKILSFNSKSDNTKKTFSKKSFFIIWIIIFLLWIPVLLAYYPTIFAYDTNYQAPHIYNYQFLTYQPLFHTLLVEFWIIIGKKIAGEEFGLLILTLFQMLVMSGIFSYSIQKIKTKINNKKANIIFTIIMIIFYGIIPFNSIMSISITKDVIFSGLILLLILNLYDLIEQNDITKKNKIAFIIISTLLMLIKNSVINVFTIFSILLILFCKQKRKIFIKLCSISIISYFFIFFTIIIIFKPVQEPSALKYRTLMQNIYYISIKHPDVLSDDFFQKNKCIQKDENVYNRYNVDDVGWLFIGCNIDIKETKKEWRKYLFKYPIEYIDSYNNTMVGLWYLNDTSHTYDIYNNWARVYLQTQQINCKQFKSKLPKLKEKYELFASGNFQYKKYKFIKYLFAPATYILTFYLMITYLIQKKRKKEIIPLLFPIIITGSILMGPCILVRYVYPFMVIVPILFFRIILHNKEEVE